jgi:hypothetical protein
MLVILDDRSSMIDRVGFRAKTFRECYDGGKFSFLMISEVAENVFDGFIPVFSEMRI